MDQVLQTANVSSDKINPWTLSDSLLISKYNTKAVLFRAKLLQLLNFIKRSFLSCPSSVYRVRYIPQHIKLSTSSNVKLSIQLLLFLCGEHNSNQYTLPTYYSETGYSYHHTYTVERYTFGT